MKNNVEVSSAQVTRNIAIAVANAVYERTADAIYQTAETAYKAAEIARDNALAVARADKAIAQANALLLVEEASTSEKALARAVARAVYDAAYDNACATHALTCAVAEVDLGKAKDKALSVYATAYASSTKT